MTNKQNFRKISYIFGTLLLIQFLILMFTNGGSEYELKKASEELKYDASYLNKSIDEKAEMLFIQQRLNMIKASRIRKFAYDLNDNEKTYFIQSFKDSILIQKSSNPKRAIEIKNEVEIIENGYNPISYIMEKILGLNSLDFLEHQKSYFFIILTVIIYLGFLIRFLLNKAK
jgi:hypothetical protein